MYIGCTYHRLRLEIRHDVLGRMKDESARCKIKLGRLCGYVVGSKFINSTLGTDTHSLVVLPMPP